VNENQQIFAWASLLALMWIGIATPLWRIARTLNRIRLKDWTR
jgi:hypothetical protein